VLAGAAAVALVPEGCPEVPHAAMTAVAPKPAAVTAAVMASFLIWLRVMIVFS
jgi:hypothetical protein